MTKPSLSSVCEFLEWDTGFFGHRIGRVIVKSLTSEVLAHILRWSNAQRIECLYYLVSASDILSLRRAEAIGFKLVDLRITLDRSLDTIETPSAQPRLEHIIRKARASDIPSLKEIAQVSHRDGRFHHDGQFAAELCDRLYEVWIEKSCTGYSDVVFVISGQPRPLGYITCSKVDAETGQIGLLAVDATAQGRGYGGALLGAGLRWFRSCALKRVIVVTQGRNITAQRLYQRACFRTLSVQLWLHRWNEMTEDF